MLMKSILTIVEEEVFMEKNWAEDIYYILKRIFKNKDIKNLGN